MRIHKKLFICLATFVFMLFCGCSSGQSSEAKSVETQINQLVTESAKTFKWMAYSINSAYEHLSEKEKATVSNYDQLLEVLAEVDEVKAYTGTWCAEQPIFHLTLEISDNGDLQWGDTLTQIWIEDGNFYHGNEIIGSACSEDGIRKITLAGICYVQRENLEEARSKKYLLVEVTPDNINEIWDEPVVLEENDVSTVYGCVSHLYKEGYVSVGASDDFKVTYYDDFSSKSPFDCITVFDKETPISISASGTLYFVKDSYVLENGFENGYRTVKLTTGDYWIENNAWYFYPDLYENYKY